MDKNSVYKDIEINHYLLNIWDNEFISSGITHNLVNCNSDHYKRLDYTADICENNHKKYFYTAIIDIRIEKNYIHSGCINGDISDGKQKPAYSIE